MESTTRQTLAAVVTGVAAAVGVAATPAAAAGAIPVPVPLGGAETALGMELPEVAGELPVPTAGAPEGRAVRRGPAAARADRFRSCRCTAGCPAPTCASRCRASSVTTSTTPPSTPPAAGLRTLAPGLSLDAPLTAPNPDALGLPTAKLPQAGLLAPAVRRFPWPAWASGRGCSPSRHRCGPCSDWPWER